MRIRINFYKTEAMRYTGHLDLQRAWERTFRRADLPLAYSQGFHPQARLNLACALPLGFTSQCELIDAWLESDLAIDHVFSALVKAAPPGIRITQINEVTGRLPALQSQVTAAEYAITLLNPTEDLEQNLIALLARPTIPRQRRGKDYDLRPLIEAMTIMPPDEHGLQRIHLHLAAREGATGRPEEVLNALGIPVEAARIHRTALVLK